MKTQDLDQFTRAYIECALWSSTEYAYGECPCCGRMAILDKYPEKEFAEDAMCSAEGCGVREIANPDPVDSNYSMEDLAHETLERMRADCAKFQAQNEIPDGLSVASAGHDFWLTRNGHGAGFWDRDELSDADQKRLTDASRAFGTCDLYVGDDGKLYLA